MARFRLGPFALSFLFGSSSCRVMHTARGHYVVRVESAESLEGV